MCISTGLVLTLMRTSGRLSQAAHVNTTHLSSSISTGSSINHWWSDVSNPSSHSLNQVWANFLTFEATMWSNIWQEQQKMDAVSWGATSLEAKYMMGYVEKMLYLKKKHKRTVYIGRPQDIFEEATRPLHVNTRFTQRWSNGFLHCTVMRKTATSKVITRQWE